MTTADEVMKRLELISQGRTHYEDLTTYEKKLIAFYIAEAFSKDKHLWRTGQSMLHYFLERHTVTAIPLIEADKPM